MGQERPFPAFRDYATTPYHHSRNRSHDVDFSCKLLYQMSNWILYESIFYCMLETQNQSRLAKKQQYYITKFMTFIICHHQRKDHVKSQHLHSVSVQTLNRKGFERIHSGNRRSSSSHMINKTSAIVNLSRCYLSTKQTKADTISEAIPWHFPLILRFLI